MALHIAYIFMHYPVPREAFGESDMQALRRLGHDVIPYSIWGKSRHEMLRGIFRMLQQPILTISAIGWALKQSGGNWKHFYKSIFVLPPLFLLLDELHVTKPDAVHIFWGHYPSFLLYLLHKTNNPVVKTMFLGAYDMNTKWPGSVAASEYAKAVFTHAHVNRQLLQERRINSKKIRVVHRGISIRPHSEEKQEYTLMMAAALVEQKRPDIALHLLVELRKKNANWRLTLCGKGPEQTNLQNLVKSLRIVNYVRFTGHISQEELFKEMRRNRYFILPTDFATERLPNVVKEAMLQECIVFTTPTLGIDELIENEKNGFITDFGNLESISSIIGTLEKDEQRRGEIGRLARKAVIEGFDAEKNMGAYVTCWQTIDNQR